MPLENLKQVLAEIANGNNLGEHITLVGATKTVSVETINTAVKNGLKVVAENKVQEFREKNLLIDGAEQQFIGHLQTNKVKYLVGKVSLIQSVDTFHLAQAISFQAVKLGVVQNILCEVNVSGEESKSGFIVKELCTELDKIRLLKNVNVVGLMTMLPATDNDTLLTSLCEEMRAIYDRLNDNGYNLSILSMGMSSDYKIAIQHGSNMIRLGSRIFGKRIYEVKENGNV